MSLHEFEEIYAKYFSRVYAFLHKMCRDNDVCEEITQETFVQAYLSFQRYDGSCEIFTWLAAIAKNTWFKYLRKKRVETVDIDILVSVADNDDYGRPEEMYMKKLKSEEFFACVSKLPKNQRDVVVLRIFADLKFSQISALLGISENSAKVIFHRAKAKLKEEMKNEL